MTLEIILIAVIRVSAVYILFILSLFAFNYVYSGVLLVVVGLNFNLFSLSDFLHSSRYNPMDLSNILNPDDTGALSSNSPRPPNPPNNGIIAGTSNTSSDNGSNLHTTRNQDETATQPVGVNAKYTHQDWVFLAEKIRVARQEVLDERTAEGIRARRVYLTDVSPKLSRDERLMLRYHGESIGKI